MSKFGIKIADVNFNELSSFSASGVVTGGLERAATKSVLRLGDIDAAYHGEVSYRNNTYYLNGKTEVRAPSFVKMLNNFAVDYSPDYPLGLFKMSAAVKTSGSVALFNQLNVNVGANSFAGSLAYQKKTAATRLKPTLSSIVLSLRNFSITSIRRTTKPISAIRRKRRLSSSNPV